MKNPYLLGSALGLILVGGGGLFYLHAQRSQIDPRDIQINDMQLQHVFDQANAALQPLNAERARLCSLAGFATPPGCSVQGGKVVAAPQPSAPQPKAAAGPVAPVAPAR